MYDFAQHLSNVGTSSLTCSSETQHLKVSISNSLMLNKAPGKRRGAGIQPARSPLAHEGPP